MITNEDKEFICEVLEVLQNSNIKIQSNESEITYENVFHKLDNHVQYPLYYRELISKEIEIISSNMCQILCKKEEKQHLFKLNAEFLEQIINNEHLLIKNEDQLLEFINELYNIDQSYSILYKYVDYLYCSSNSMQGFLTIFPNEYFEQEIWTGLKERLKATIELTSHTRKQKHKKRHVKFLKGNQDFDGIVNYLQQASNNQIKNEIEITASSINGNSYGPYNSVQYNNKTPFETTNSPNSWICFEFKNHQIIPTHYTIRTRQDFDCHHLRSWKIEISNNKSDWEEIDKHTNCQLLTKESPIQTFSIDQSKQKEAKFIRLTQTGPNSLNSLYLIFDSIEFYGELL